ncbi:hypothetical protein BC939DRAFT_501436 [Gamsiella multidivaricata]|uniref:uncharacterized protein n=1 Tax=Gamsiella multidivaricata TaxID=101098 RepID=UPI00221F3E65|nr:uncharacterized protein BC939DRAFT_501436 [Gamsiella multidivaricata]KAI7827103.1 hypothetical protein BC939DRAFT_501436 [Gamsiella multidivaricata]
MPSTALAPVQQQAPPLPSPHNPTLAIPMGNADIPDEPTSQLPSGPILQKSRLQRIRRRIGITIEAKAAHIIILILTLADIALIILQIGASLLHLDETEEETWFIALFGHLSLAIVSMFMLEILLKLFAFGPRYFWRGTRHGVLHLIDAMIIITSFMLEIFLHGAAEELTALLILFRLWRVVKLTGTVALEVSEHDEARAAALEAKIQHLERELEEYRLKVSRLERFNDLQGQ